MSKFKVGDKVKCTYSSGGTNFIPGHIYKVVTNTLNQPAIAVEANGQLIPMAVMCDSYHWYDFERVALPVTVITTDGTTTTATLREGKRVIRTATAKCSPADTYDYATGAKLAFDRLFTEPAETKPKNPALMFKVGDRVWDVKEKSYATIICVDEKDDSVPYKVKYAGGNTHWRCKHNVVPCGPDAEPPKPKCYTGKMVCIKSGYPWWTVGKVYDIMDGTITADDGAKYSGYISAEDARHAGRTIGGAPFPGSDAGHNPNNEFIPFVEK